MNSFDEILENSRLADMIERIERGESVDTNRVLTLQALDVARVGELFVKDAIEREREFDDEFRSQLATER